MRGKPYKPPARLRIAICPERGCSSPLSLVEKPMYDEGELVDEGRSRRLWRCEDKGAALLFVRGGALGPEEVLRNSGSPGTGPTGNAGGVPSCPVHGDLDVDAICAAYERPQPNRR